MRICVFCGSKTGVDQSFSKVAVRFAESLALAKHDLVYGGGNIGLMGIIADAALAVGGNVIGVIPGSLAELEIAHPKLTELHVVKSMHERKALMTTLSDAFVALPGGFGTLDETFEILTWAQLRFHNKPVGLINVAGYYNSLLQFLDHQLAMGFLRQDHRDLLLVEIAPEKMLKRLEQAHAVQRPDLRSPVEP